MVKSLFIVTAAIEAGAGMALLAAPALAISFLLGPDQESPATLIICRVAGGALLSLAIGCGTARQDGQSRAATALIWAMLFYNASVAAVLVQARFGPGLSGVGLWPGVVLHVGMGLWCGACLRQRNT